MKKVLERLRDRRYLRFWLMVAGIVVALLGFEEVVDDVFHDPSEGDFEAQQFDQAIGTWVRGLRNPALTQVMTDFTALGSVSVLTTLFVLLISVIATYRDFRGLSYLAIAGIGAAVWPVLLKGYFRRPRPELSDHLAHVTDLSFPSGHTFAATALYIALAYYSGRYAEGWRRELFFYLLGAMMILLVGSSRIYLGVHYPTDVLAGLSGGAVWGLLVSAVFEYFRPRSPQSAPPSMGGLYGSTDRP